MRQVLWLFGWFAALAGAVPADLPAGAPGAGRFVDSYCNPLNVQLADPFVMHWEGEYYLYGTWDRNPCRGVPVYTSKDLANWRFRGFALEPGPHTWSKQHFWGPEVVPWKGRFLMYFNASPNPTPAPPFNMHLCLAEGASPLGPFKELKAPWYSPEGPDEAIDQHLLLDDDGQAYLYFTRVGARMNYIQGVKLKPDLTSFDGEPRDLIKPTEPWESRAWEGHKVVEGAFCLKHKGLYYLVYTANHFLDDDYCEGCAVSEKPLGPFRKVKGNPLLHRTAEVAGPGSACFAKSPDGRELFIVYHTHQSPREVGWRQLAIDRAKFVPQAEGPDKLVIEGPTVSPQPLPSGAKGPARAESDDFAGPELDWDRWQIINELPGFWQVKQGKLQITALDGDCWGPRADFANLCVQYAPKGDFEVKCRLQFAPERNFEQAGLVLWQDHDNYVRFTSAFSEGRKLLAVHEKAGVAEVHECANAFGDALELKVVRRGGSCRLLAEGEGQGEVEVARFEVKFACERVGVMALAPGSKRKPVAEFSNFEVKRL